MLLLLLVAEEVVLSVSELELIEVDNCVVFASGSRKTAFSRLRAGVWGMWGEASIVCVCDFEMKRGGLYLSCPPSAKRLHVEPRLLCSVCSRASKHFMVLGISLTAHSTEVTRRSIMWRLQGRMMI